MSIGVKAFDIGEEEAKAKIDDMIAKDGDTSEVVASLRRQGRAWTSILRCFRDHMITIGVNPNR